jgi:hypothetical protein
VIAGTHPFGGVVLNHFNAQGFVLEGIDHVKLAHVSTSSNLSCMKSIDQN